MKIGISVFILSAAAFVVFIYIFPGSELIHIYLDSSGIGFLNREMMKNESVDSKKMEEAYKEEASRIVSEYFNLTESREYTSEPVDKIKQKLLDLTVPAEFKDLHLNLVLAMSQMEIFLDSGREEAKIASQELMTEAKANYGWLTEN